MSSDWNVDDAVNEVMAWIHDGSALPFLKLPDDLKLKTTYHDRFQRAKERGIDWNLARKRVLPLAYRSAPWPQCSPPSIFADFGYQVGGSPGVLREHSLRLAVRLLQCLVHQGSSRDTVGSGR